MTGTIARVGIAPEGTRAANPAFDVTPARLVTGNHGARNRGRFAWRVKALFPERFGLDVWRLNEFHFGVFTCLFAPGVL